MITVVKTFLFDAAHMLPNYDGLCKNIHGHTYKLEIGVSGSINLHSGMVVDFAQLKQLVQDSICKYLDHTYLNEVDQVDFPRHMPTAENMVAWIHAILQAQVEIQTEPRNRHLQFIRLWETPTSYAEWRRGV